MEIQTLTKEEEKEKISREDSSASTEARQERKEQEAIEENDNDNEENDTENVKVFLKCMKIGGKLRVCVVSNGYLNSANCQFPREIRKEGRGYLIQKNDIHLITTRGKYYYSVRNTSRIEIVDDISSFSSPLLSTSSSSLSPSATVQKKKKEEKKSMTVFEDETTDECVICWSSEKSVVFDPCGHFYCCSACSNKIFKCPICRKRILKRIPKELMG